MIATDATRTTDLASRRGDGPWARALRQLTRHRIGAAGGVVVALVILVALFANVVAPYDPTSQMSDKLVGPGPVHWLGADEFGRDVLSRIIHGARISIYVGVISVTIAVLGGTTLGIAAGYFGGRIDNIIMRLMDILFAFPSLVLAIAITGILGPSLTNAMLAIGVVVAPSFARVIRGPVLSVVQEEYVTAARAMGATHWRAISRHVFPNIVAPLIVQISVAFPGAILTEAGLSFLGLGTQPPNPSWGTMLGTGRQYMEVAPWVAVFPGLAIMVTVLGFNLLGDGLRDALDPRLRATD
jgi:peptide/nickel transport system permease protein